MGIDECGLGDCHIVILSDNVESKQEYVKDFAKMIVIFGNNAQVFDLGDISHNDLVGSFNNCLTIIVSNLFLQLVYKVGDLLLEHAL